MRPVPPLLLSLCLLTAGCRNPEDPVFIFGRALSAEGAPLGGLALTLERGPALRWNDEEDTSPRAYAPYASAITEADGDFTLEAIAGDLQRVEDNSQLHHPLRVVLPLREDGQGVFITFDNAIASLGDVELPPLRPWDARLGVDGGAEGPRLRFTAPPSVELPPSAQPILYSFFSEDGTQYEYPLTVLQPEPLVQLYSGAERLWLRRGTAEDGWSPGPFVLEDFASPRAQLRALSLGQWVFTPLASLSGNLAFREEWRTAPVALPAGSLRPVSRGARCEPEPSPAGACPWTDGQLARVELPEDELDESRSRQLVLHFDTPVRLRRAVVRGLQYGFISLGAKTLFVEGSTDGLSWTRLGEQRVEDVLRQDQETVRYIYQQTETSLNSVNPYGDAPIDRFGEEPVYADVPLADTPPVRHVRVRVRLDDEARDMTLRALSELSLFASE